MARNKMVSFLLLILKMVVAVYLGLALLLFFYQKKLLYLPSIYSTATAAALAEEKSLDLWMEGERGWAYIGRHAPAEAKGTILLLHGNGGSALGRAVYRDILEPLGFRVILCEYPGYGACPGRHGQKPFVAAATQAIQRARTLYGAPLYLIGESLGCGVAAAALRSNPGCIRGVLLIMPWDNLGDLAQAVYPFFPTKWLTRDRYDNVRNLSGFTGPIGIVMAGEDEIIPNRHTQRLYDALAGRKHLWSLEDVGHNDWIEAVDADWWQEVITFLSGAGAAHPGEDAAP